MRPRRVNLAPARRSYALGVAVRRALREYGGVERVALLGTGAPSHWIGTPEMGRIDEEWDERVIGHLREGDAKGLSEWTQPEIDAGGNGANEIRNWIAASAAAGGGPAEVWSYQAEPKWFTAVTVMEFSVGPPL